MVHVMRSLIRVHVMRVVDKGYMFTHSNFIIKTAAAAAACLIKLFTIKLCNYSVIKFSNLLMDIIG